MLKTFKINFFLLLVNALIFFGFLATSVLAFDFEADSGAGYTAKKAGYYDSNLTNNSLAVVVGKIIRQAIIYLGVFFLLLTIYAGFIWMFSRGNEQEVEKAKQILQNALIGLIIVLLAYAITYFFMLAFS